MYYILYYDQNESEQTITPCKDCELKSKLAEIVLKIRENEYEEPNVINLCESQEICAMNEDEIIIIKGECIVPKIKISVEIEECVSTKSKGKN